MSKRLETSKFPQTAVCLVLPSPAAQPLAHQAEFPVEYLQNCLLFDSVHRSDRHSSTNSPSSIKMINVSQTATAVYVIPGKRFYFIFSVLLIFVGIGSLISSSLVLTESNNTVIGSVYTGALAIIAGSLGWYFPNKYMYITYLTSVILSLAAAIVGSIAQGSGYSIVTGIDACSDYTSKFTSDSCKFTDLKYNCYGDKAAFDLAYSCAYTWVENHGTSGNTCSCVYSTSPSGSCYHYDISNCDSLFTTIPQVLEAALVFDVLCAAFSVCILITSLIGCSCPTVIESAAERDSKYARPESSTPEKGMELIIP